MSWALHAAIFAVALVALVASADRLVEYGARIARRLGVSDLVIGLTLTSVGTSVPELASSISAAAQNNPGLVLGNICGSNIANIGLITGIAAAFYPFSTNIKMHERDGHIVLASAILFFALALDNGLGRPEALLFLLIYVAYVGFVASSDRDKVGHQFRYFLNYVVRLDVVRPLAGAIRKRSHRRDEDGGMEADHSGHASETAPGSRKALALDLLALAASCVGVVLGAQQLVQEATWAALQLGIPSSVVGLSVIAVGTSLPELIVAVAAAKKGNAEMVIGNVMGSNLANTLLIPGVAGLIRPLEVSEVSVSFTIPVMLFFTVGLLYLVKSGWRVSRLQGALAFAAYLAFMTAAFFQT